MHKLTGSHLIDGQWRQERSSRTFDAIDPSTGATLPPVFFSAVGTEANSAAEAAKRAFDLSLDLPPKWSADLLDKIAANILDLGNALLERVEKETALPRARVTGERGRTVNQLKMFAGIAREGSWGDATIDTADPNRQPLPKPDLRRMLRARGPIAVFGASNFPLAFGVCGGDTASALAAGNSIVAKGHPSHPGTNELFASAVLDALQTLNLPIGLFNLVQGPGNEVGAALVNHPFIEAVGFTGSLRGGRALFDLAAKRDRPIPVFAEMGSVNPILLLRGALSENSATIANGLAQSILGGAGQFCTKPGVIFVPSSQVDDLSQAIVKALAAASELVMLNYGLRDNFCERCSHLSEIPGVKTIVKSNPTGHASISPGLYETDTEHFLSQLALREEAFGPAALLVKYENEADALRCIDAIGGSLTASLHIGKTDNPTIQKRALAHLESIAGRVIVNGFPTGVEVNDAVVHGGPYPATTDSNSTSVGSAAIRRFVRMVAFQNVPDELLPPALQNANPLQISRTINGQRTKANAE
ncbi:MAG TPA: aldehyde dehydrogenase (NADP(+)) [Tepidisphaeraceae bacterium]|jgi:NADP-dependent aldehyde dehydrogenase